MIWLRSALLTVLALCAAEWFISRPSKPPKIVEGCDWLTQCRNGGAA